MRSKGVQSVFSSAFDLIESAHHETAVGNHHSGAGRYFHRRTGDWRVVAAPGWLRNGARARLQHVGNFAASSDALGVGDGQVRDGESGHSGGSTAEHDSPIFSG